jgi:peptidyl-prolyl cis-trans isomerase SurA
VIAVMLAGVIALQYSLDTRALERALEQQGMTLAGYREQIRRQYITQSLINEFVSSRITLLSQEVEKYYKDHAAEYGVPEEVTLSEIIIPIVGDENEAAAKAAIINPRRDGGKYKSITRINPDSGSFAKAASF